MKIKVTFDLQLYNSTEMEPAFFSKVEFLSHGARTYHTTNEHLKGRAIGEVQQLIMDALHEFTTVTRLDPKSYVEQRYSWMGDEERDRKRKQVIARCQMAQILLHSMTVPELEGDDG